jgi:hypothetical protein
MQCISRMIPLFKNAALLRQNVQKMPNLYKLGTTPRGSWGVPVPSKQPIKDADTTVREILQDNQ